jgi:hypothetical protein
MREMRYPYIFVENQSVVGKMNPVIQLEGGEDAICKQIAVG